MLFFDKLFNNVLVNFDSKWDMTERYYFEYQRVTNSKSGILNFWDVNRATVVALLEQSVDVFSIQNNNNNNNNIAIEIDFLINVHQFIQSNIEENSLNPKDVLLVVKPMVLKLRCVMEGHWPLILESYYTSSNKMVSAIYLDLLSKLNVDIELYTHSSLYTCLVMLPRMYCRVESFVTIAETLMLPSVSDMLIKIKTNILKIITDLIDKIKQDLKRTFTSLDLYKSYFDRHLRVEESGDNFLFFIKEKIIDSIETNNMTWTEPQLLKNFEITRDELIDVMVARRRPVLADLSNIFGYKDLNLEIFQRIYKFGYYSIKPFFKDLTPSDAILYRDAIAADVAIASNEDAKFYKSGTEYLLHLTRIQNTLLLNLENKVAPSNTFTNNLARFMLNLNENLYVDDDKVAALKSKILNENTTGTRIEIRNRIVGFLEETTTTLAERQIISFIFQEKTFLTYFLWSGLCFIDVRNGIINKISKTPTKFENSPELNKIISFFNAAIPSVNVSEVETSLNELERDARNWILNYFTTLVKYFKLNGVLTSLATKINEYVRGALEIIDLDLLTNRVLSSIKIFSSIAYNTTPNSGSKLHSNIVANYLKTTIKTANKPVELLTTNQFKQFLNLTIPASKEINSLFSKEYNIKLFDSDETAVLPIDFIKLIVVLLQHDKPLNVTCSTTDLFGYLFNNWTTKLQVFPIKEKATIYFIEKRNTNRSRATKAEKDNKTFEIYSRVGNVKASLLTKINWHSDLIDLKYTLESFYNTTESIIVDKPIPQWRIPLILPSINDTKSVTATVTLMNMLGGKRKIDDDNNNNNNNSKITKYN